MTKYLVCAALVLLVLAGCPAGEQTGSLVLILSAPDVASRTVVPGLDMNISSWTLSGTAPGGEPYGPVPISGGVNVIEGLATGTWTIVVDAYNADDPPTRIATGSATPTVLPRDIVTVEITVEPLGGAGTLDLSVSWPDGSVLVPQVTATLADLGGTTYPVSFDVEGLLATETVGGLPAGYYDLAVQLADNGEPLWGAFEIVRIVAGQTTYFEAYAPLSDLGGVSIDVSSDMHPPIAVTLSGVLSYPFEGTLVTVTADAPGYAGAYRWYLDGVFQLEEANGEATFGPGGFAEGTHRVDVRVRSGTVAGSATWSFTE